MAISTNRDDEKRYCLVKEIVSDNYSILDTWYICDRRGTSYDKVFVDDALVETVVGEAYYDNPYGSNYSYDELGYFIAWGDTVEELKVIMEECAKREEERLNKR